MALAAEADLLSHLRDRFAEVHHGTFFLFDQMQDKSQGCLLADAWQSGQLIDRIFQ
jgi:hypothetical protein